MERPAPVDSPALARLQQVGLMLGAAGLIAGVVGGVVDRSAGDELIVGLSPQFFRSWLIGFLFCAGLTLGSLGWIMLHHLSGGQWGLVTRRVWEAGTRTLPVVAVFFLPIALGAHAIFEWSHTDLVQTNAILQQKEPYLNVSFFLIRALIYFALWMLCVAMLNRWSAAQDRGELATTPADMVRFRKVSAPGILFLVLTVTFASTDWIMSLEPEWYSTIFGLLTTASYGLSALALSVIVLTAISPRGELASVIAPKHFHDLGKFMLAFVMLWAYLAFSQFLIIWSGNLPEEIPWYIKRMQGVWGWISVLLIVGHFFLPFLLLLSRDLKRRPHLLSKVAVFVLVMTYAYNVWLVAPAFEHHGFPIHWLDIALPAGLFGIWLMVFARNLRSRALVPHNDPYFREAFAHEAH
jgi:hypothetical protein